MAKPKKGSKKAGGAKKGRKGGAKKGASKRRAGAAKRATAQRRPAAKKGGAKRGAKKGRAKKGGRGGTLRVKTHYARKLTPVRLAAPRFKRSKTSHPSVVNVAAPTRSAPSPYAGLAIATGTSGASLRTGFGRPQSQAAGGARFNPSKGKRKSKKNKGGKRRAKRGASKRKARRNPSTSGFVKRAEFKQLSKRVTKLRDHVDEKFTQVNKTLAKVRATRALPKPRRK